jgi:hypothetical protein
MNNKVVTGTKYYYRGHHDPVPDREENLAASDDEITDEAILDYVAAARPVQELLRQLLTQLAGYSLVLMTREKPALRPEAAMPMARTAAEHAGDRVRALSVPAAAAHHHCHLSNAVDAIRWAFVSVEKCAAAGATDAERDTLTRTLRTASEHLRATARRLPGFDMVDFNQACCAAHGLMRRKDMDSGFKEEKNGGLFNMGSGIRCG